MRGTVLLSTAALLLLAHSAAADQVTLNAALANPLLKANEKQVTYLKIGLTGFTLEREGDRAPVNIALVIDTSGSMTGEKISKAKDAALLAIDRLGSRDIVSVLEYNSTVNVLVPATKLTDKTPVREAIKRLTAGGSTALYAGVSKGAAELRKFMDKNRVNRVILISDGIANVGPSSPVELGQLGESLVKEGISVTTIGLGTGYNEDLMSTLAGKSDANHYFAENATDLARTFNHELGDVLSVVAQEIVVTIECGEGIRPVRLLGRDGDIVGQRVTSLLNQLYSEQEKYVLLEVEVPASPVTMTRPVATVTVTYANMGTKTNDTLTSSLSVRFSEDTEVIAHAVNKPVMAAAVEQIATLTSRRAVTLRDEGKLDEARKLLEVNGRFLRENGKALDSEKLESLAEAQQEDADNLDEAKWNKQRKEMRDRQSASATQRSERGSQ